jgi:hypothetical protein
MNNYLVLACRESPNHKTYPHWAELLTKFKTAKDYVKFLDCQELVECLGCIGYQCPFVSDRSCNMLTDNQIVLLLKGNPTSNYSIRVSLTPFSKSDCLQIIQNEEVFIFSYQPQQYKFFTKNRAKDPLLEMPNIQCCRRKYSIKKKLRKKYNHAEIKVELKIDASQGFTKSLAGNYDVKKDLIFKIQWQ